MPDGEMALLKRSVEKKLKLLGKQQACKTPLVECIAYLLLDCSGSMAGDNLVQAKNGAINFSDEAIMKGYCVGVISFGSHADHVIQPVDDITKLSRSVKKLAVQGSTNMAAALHLAAEKFPSPTSDGAAVVLVTDGYPDDEEEALKAARRIKSLGVDIITIGTEDADLCFLEEIASRKDLAVPVKTEELCAGIESTVKLLPGGNLMT